MAIAPDDNPIDPTQVYHFIGFPDPLTKTQLSDLEQELRDDPEFEMPEFSLLIAPHPVVQYYRNVVGLPLSPGSFTWAPHAQS